MGGGKGARRVERGVVKRDARKGEVWEAQETQGREQCSGRPMRRRVEG